MIAADDAWVPGHEYGFSFYTGVPSSFLTPLINRLIGDRSLDHVGATSEGEAVAIAAGAWLAGRQVARRFKAFLARDERFQPEKNTATERTA